MLPPPVHWVSTEPVPERQIGPVEEANAEVTACVHAGFVQSLALQADASKPPSLIRSIAALALGAKQRAVRPTTAASDEPQIHRLCPTLIPPIYALVELRRWV